MLSATVPESSWSVGALDGRLIVCASAHPHPTRRPDPAITPSLTASEAPYGTETANAHLITTKYLLSTRDPTFINDNRSSEYSVSVLLKETRNQQRNLTPTVKIQTVTAATGRLRLYHYAGDHSLGDQNCG